MIFVTFEHEFGMQVTPPAEDTAAVALSPEEAEQRRKFEEIWDAKTIEQGCQIFSAHFFTYLRMSQEQFSFIILFMKRKALDTVLLQGKVIVPTERLEALIHKDNIEKYFRIEEKPVAR